MKEKEIPLKEIPLEERIEKIFESGWVNEFNYLENLMQETRSCLYDLQQELQRKDNIINELKKWLEVKEEKETIGTFSDVLDKINELEVGSK